MKDLPVYDITISEDIDLHGVSKISLVDIPAIGVNWIALKKQPKMLMAKPECFGCPPNGDGTKANGEPDRRCKEGGGDKVSTTNSISNLPKFEEGGKIIDKEEIAKILEVVDKTSIVRGFDKTPNDKIDGEDARIVSSKEIADEIDKVMKTPQEIYSSPRGQGNINGREIPNELEFPSRERATQIAIYNITGQWNSVQDAQDFIDGKTMNTYNGIWIAPESGKGRLFRKQTFARRECLGCHTLIKKH